MKIPHFVTWKNVEEGYYTKTKLRNDFGLKPKNLEDYDATLKAYQSGSWRDFVLYHVDNTVEIKKRKIADLEATNENLAEALYLINKSAKVSRDTKTENYSRRRHGVVKSAKTRETKLYALKNFVIEKMLAEGKMQIVGYHAQKSDWDDHLLYFLVCETEGYQFHIPESERIANEYENLGVIEKIAAERTRNVSLNFFEAEKLLRKYIAIEEVSSAS